MVHILLVDDNPDFLVQAPHYLAKIAGTSIVGCAASGRAGIAMADALRPQLILMDFSMPEMNGLEAARQIKRQNLSTKVAIMSFHEIDMLRTQVEGDEVDGYVSKMDFVDDLKRLLKRLFGNVQSGNRISGDSGFS
jgi:DNA-binding NarL/FixJ family response regulator